MGGGELAKGGGGLTPSFPPLLLGGPLTVTDANLCLGRLLPDYFPCIFGPNEDQPLSQEATRQAFQELTARVNAFQDAGSALSLEEVAMGFVRVANEAMCRPIRALTQVWDPLVAHPSLRFFPVLASLERGFLHPRATSLSLPPSPSDGESVFRGQA